MQFQMRLSFPGPLRDTSTATACDREGDRGLRARVSLLAPLLIYAMVFGFISVELGQDANWDLRNYHLYNAYALLHHRLDLRIAGISANAG